MNTILINVTDTINSPSALTRDQGKIIYDKIIDNLSHDNNIVLDFSNTERIIAPFLNVAIGKLYEHYSSEELKNRMKITNVPEGKVSSFNVVISNAKRYYSN